MKKKILIVEDEVDIITLIQNRLNEDLFTIDFALDGQEAMNCLLSQVYDLVILDIMLPKVNGLEICTYLHKHHSKTFIFIMSAITKESQKIKAFELGADSYICKPFSPRVLVSEVMALFRRCNTYEYIVSQNEITLKANFYQVIINGHTLQLTPSEYLIFTTLLKNRCLPFSRAELSSLIYDYGQGEISERGIDSHVSHIRKKLQCFEQKNFIETVHGIGYVINAS